MRFLFPLAGALICGSGLLTAQSASDSSPKSSPNYFSASQTTVPGGAAASGTYAVQATIGEQEPGAASSTTYAVAGGFTATLGGSGSTAIVAGATPRFVNPLGNDLVFLNGTRLTVGGVPAVTVGGRPATVVASTPSTLAIQLPSLTEPGWQRIELTNSLGTTSLERGIGVMPMLFSEGAAGSSVPFDLVFKGTQNDMGIWTLGFSAIPPVPLAPYLHGLTVNPLPLIRVLPAFVITEASGERRRPIPPVPFNFPIHIQALLMSTNPGYAPGSFTNRLVFE